MLLPLAFGLFAVQAVIAIILSGSTIGVLVAVILNVVLGVIFQGIVIELARDVQDGTLDSSIGQLISAVTPAIVPLILVGIVTGILVGIGFLLLIVPGIWALTVLAVVGPVTVIERPGVFAALGRSRDLVKGSGWQVLALILFNFVIGFILGAVGGLIGAAGGDVGGAIAQWIVNSVLVPLTALVIAIAYLRLRDAHGEPPINTGVATPSGPAPAGPSPFS